MRYEFEKGDVIINKRYGGPCYLVLDTIEASDHICVIDKYGIVYTIKHKDAYQRCGFVDMEPMLKQIDTR